MDLADSRRSTYEAQLEQRLRLSAVQSATRMAVRKLLAAAALQRPLDSVLSELSVLQTTEERERIQLESLLADQPV